MESQPQNPEFRINPETFTHGCVKYSFRMVNSVASDIIKTSLSGVG